MNTTTHDECPLCRSLFEETSGDPWRDLLQPALFRVPSLVDERLGLIAAEPDREQRGRLQAVGARALYALDRPVQARTLLDLALRADVREAHALAVLVGADPFAAAQRLVQSGSPGERADGACDGVLAALRAGDATLAVTWLARALALCPDHGEAHRWWRYCDAAGEQASPLLWSVDHQDVEIEQVLATGRVSDPMLGHLADLLPRPWEGYISRERMLRRHRSLHRGRPAVAGSGLARLRETGRVGRWLDRDEGYAALTADHPRVQVEVALDRARADLAAGRPCWSAVEDCWRLAPALSLFHRSRLVCFVALLALQDPGVGPLADHASDAVLDELPQDPDLLAARAAVLMVVQGPGSPAPDLARRALRAHRISGLGTVLAIETLRRAGAERTVRRALRERVSHPEHGWLVDVWLQDLDQPPLEDGLWDLPDRWDGERSSGKN